MTCYQLLTLFVCLNIKLLEIEGLESSLGHDLGKAMPIRGDNCSRMPYGPWSVSVPIFSPGLGSRIRVVSRMPGAPQEEAVRLLRAT